LDSSAVVLRAEEGGCSGSVSYTSRKDSNLTTKIHFTSAGRKFHAAGK